MNVAGRGTTLHRVGAEGVCRLRGRARELAVLVEAFRATRSGHASAVLVGGDGGVGKTRMVEELARHARQHGAVILTGNAVDIADAPPFWPVMSAIRNAARTETDAAMPLREWLARLPHPNGDGPGAGPPVVLLDLCTSWSSTSPSGARCSW